MKQWFMMLNSREKTLVSLALVIVPLMLLWMLVMRPMLNKHDQLQQRIQDRSQQLSRMRQQTNEFKTLNAGGGQRSSVRSRGNPQQKIESALRNWRLRPNLGVMNASGSKTVKLNLQNAEADNVMRFLHDLETRYGFAVKNLSMKPTSEVGLSNVSLTVEQQQ